MLTTDISGTYDYEREEAVHAFSQFMKYRHEYSQSEQEQYVEREFLHWQKVLDSEGFTDFCCAWNECAMSAGIVQLGLCMIA